MKTIVLNPHMGQDIINHLNQFGDLPRRGLVAGQAVASAISELFGDGRAVVYNDVDVFEPFSASTPSYRLHMLRTGESDSAIGTLDFMANDDGYGELQYRLANRAVEYSVIKSVREGMINRIECESRSNAYLGILRSFDMNNVQVGVDLKNKRLIWTNAFADFLQSFEIEIVRLHTPMHSIIRYFLKKEELAGVTGNDERMAELVSAAHQLIRRPILDDSWVEEDGTPLVMMSHIAQWQMGVRYQEKLDRVRNQLSPYFLESQEEIRGYAVAELTPLYDVADDLLAVNRGNFLHELPLVSKVLRDSHTTEQEARLKYLLSAKSETSALRRFWCMHGASFVHGDVSPVDMAAADLTLSERHLSKAVIDERLDTVVRRVESIQDEAIARGAWVFGFFESRSSTRWEADSISQELDSYVNYLRSYRVRPLMGTVVIDGYEVKELLNGEELMTENAEMHHFIGDLEAYPTDTWRVLSLRIPGSSRDTWLTMPLRRLQFELGWVDYGAAGVGLRKASQGEQDVLCKAQLYFASSEFFGRRVTDAVLKIPGMSGAELLEMALLLRTDIQDLLDYRSKSKAWALKLRGSAFCGDKNAYHEPMAFWWEVLTTEVLVSKSKRQDA